MSGIAPPKRRRGRPRQTYADPGEPLSPTSDPNVARIIDAWSSLGQVRTVEYRGQALQQSPQAIAEAADAEQEQFPRYSTPPYLTSYDDCSSLADCQLSAADEHASLLSHSSCPLVYASNDRWAAAAIALPVLQSIASETCVRCEWNTVCYRLHILLIRPHSTWTGVQAGRILCACLQQRQRQFGQRKVHFNSFEDVSSGKRASAGELVHLQRRGRNC